MPRWKLSPPTGPGWVYVLKNPDFRGCCKIGGTSRTASHRARELVREYGTAAPWKIVRRYAVPDWFAVEQTAHRMLADCRLPASELFRCSPWRAGRVIKAAAFSYRHPALASAFRRRLLASPVRRRWKSYRRGTNWLPLLAVLSIAAAGVVIVQPSPADWWPSSIARTVLLLERL